MFEATQVTPDQLTRYDNVIYGGGLYAVGINGVGLIKANLPKLRGKKVVVFAVGASPERSEVMAGVRNKNFTAEQQQQLRFFYLRGGFDYRRLNRFYKMVMTLMKWQLSKKQELTPDEQGILAAYEHPVDFTKRENVAPIVAYITGND